MIQSMTGFGRGEASDDQFNIVVEIKSVNHRFKDLRFKMSSQLASIELELRNMLTAKFKRGSFDISVNVKRAETNLKFDDIDDKKVTAFINKAKVWAEVTDTSLDIKPIDFMRSEFLKEQDDSRSEETKGLVKEAFAGALEELEKARLSEGEKMVAIIKKHRDQYLGFYSKIPPLTETFKKTVEERLKKRFAEFSSELKVDEPRFLQEVVYYLEKLDVHEEINRIQAHLEKLEKLVSAKGEVGRQIDFLIQELNRETNTIGSKSDVEEISESVVQMKVQLEKIREQGLNLE